MRKNSIIVVLFLLFIAGLFLTVAIKLLAFNLGNEYKFTSEKTIISEAMRGAILSAEGKELAYTRKTYDIAIDLHFKNKRGEIERGDMVISDTLFNNNVEVFADSLSKVTDKTKSQWLQILKERRAANRGYTLLVKNVDIIVRDRILKFPIFNAKSSTVATGLNERAYIQRELPFGNTAKRTIGDMSKYSGMEGLYDTLLKGQNGITVTMQRGAYTAERVKAEKRDGYDVVSTLDMSVQDIAETALRACLDSNDADFGCTIVMEVASGNIVAMTNLMKDSSYAKRYTEQWNFAIGNRFDPGSTIKLATLLAVLEDGMKLSDKVKGYKFEIHDKVIWDDHNYGDPLTLQDAFEHSSNAGLASAAVQRFGKKEAKFTDYLSKWHLNAKLGIGFNGEADPLFITPTNKKYWDGTSLAFTAHGYFEEYSPIQIITLYNAVANNGKMVKPRFATELRYPNTKNVYKTFDTVVLCEKICSDATLAATKQCLEGVVLRGTGQSLKNMPFTIAGKTGTAVINYKQKDQKKQYRATWVGYFPADNPKYTCYVMVENPKKNKIYAAEVAIPVFKSIIKKISNEMHVAPKDEIPPTEGQVSQNDSVAKNTPKVRYAKAINTEEMTQITHTDKMPNLIGYSGKDAVYILEKMGLKVKLSGRGIVSSQSIEVGNDIIKGKTIILTLS